MSEICVVIPAYNEAEKITLVLKKIKGHNVDVIVVDDGSTDNTASIVEREEVFLIRHTSNDGKGGALKSGFRFAIEKGYEFIITLDADGQHDPAELPLFIEKIHNSNAGLIVGNRLHRPENMPLGRLFVNKLFSKIVSGICEQYIPDALSGYRIIRRDALAAIRLYTNKFDIDPEILIRMAKSGFEIDFINVRCIYAGETSHISHIRDAKNFFKLTIREKKSRNEKRQTYSYNQCQ